MKKPLRLRLALFASVLVVAGLVWACARFDRSATIPLIDRNDPAYADALFYLDRRALSVVSGRPNGSYEGAPDDQRRRAEALARARLSQSVYEASLARVESRPDKTVVLSIPTYRWAGWKLERHVRNEVLGGTGDAELCQRTEKFFFDYGRAHQTLTVSRETVQQEGQSLPAYRIVHQFGGWGVIP